MELLAKNQQYWPFNQDALRKHKEWLRKWFMDLGNSFKA
jgi:hypothetical protein